MKKEKVLVTFEELGFELEDAGDLGYFFRFEELNYLYLPDDDDEQFFRLALPHVFDVTTENNPFVLEVVNDTNLSLKYSKTCVINEHVWIFYEYLSFGDDNVEEIIEHGIRVLQATIGLLYRKIEGDDSFPGEEE